MIPQLCGSKHSNGPSHNTFNRTPNMNEILNKFQKDLSKLQKTIEAEGEVLLGKLMTAANKATSNKNVVAKRKELEKLVEKQISKLEPAFEKFYKEAKSTASKYGVSIDKIENIEKKVRSKAKTKAKSKTTKADAGKVKKTATKAPASTAKSAVGGAKKAKTKKKA
jgi:septal ring factor EnvC (AmiA/AmiB activator)